MMMKKELFGNEFNDEDIQKLLTGSKENLNNVTFFCCCCLPKHRRLPFAGEREIANRLPSFVNEISAFQ